jgi:cobaltochelatase CobN
MHLLAAQRGDIADGNEAVDLGQTPAEIVVLTAADSEIALLAAARERAVAAHGAEFPQLRLANLMRLSHHLSVDLYVDQVIRHARLVVVRLLGGRGYWPHGVDQIVATCRANGIKLALVPGDDRPDPELVELSTMPAADVTRCWHYLVHGGGANALELLRYAAAAISFKAEWQEPAPILRAGLYLPGVAQPTIDDVRRTWRADAPVAAVIFYRALVQAADTSAIDAMIAALGKAGLNPLPIYVASLKDSVAAATVQTLFAAAAPDIVLNATGFAIAAPDSHGGSDPLAMSGCPVLQIVLAGGSEAQWREGTRGLSARDIAMNVALTEIDGRIMTRAIAFKRLIRDDGATETGILGLEAVPDRTRFVAELAANWTRLRQAAPVERRVALILANYPNRDGRLANGVGLDTPESIVEILRALKAAGYRIEDAPGDGGELMARFLAGPTNDARHHHERVVSEEIKLIDYSAFFGSLPQSTQQQVLKRWGPPESDPSFRPGALDCGTLPVAALRFGNVVVGLQPARGYHLDVAVSHHDPDMVPPHAYLAFYAWLRDSFRAHAMVHVGKHGNLEWLPGKAIALSEQCWPEAVLGPLPNLYPFIVNDPGEGTQAKRRAGAVIIDHLTPPLTRAGSYGPLAALERLIDEYYEAASQDPRRLKILAGQIRDVAAASGVDRDCGIERAEADVSALGKLDGFLCELKESQIRDGLHVFGRSPTDAALVDLLVAIARCPRGDGQGRNASLLRALTADLDLDFDPLDTDMAAAWTGARPAVLGPAQDWRTGGDTVERLENLAAALVAGSRRAEPDWTRTPEVLAWIAAELRPAIARSGSAEIEGLLAGLDGRRVPAGPSGAPTRGRADVLPTGRNFFSVDTRAVPTPSAWMLGWKSAGLLLARHVQDHGEYPKTIAISAWGTSNMRTAGDDIAQALALIGVRPTWDQSSRRVTGFEILPLSLLDRPRVDVTLRISGFFRDAFPNLIDLFDSAVRDVAALDEPEAMNPLAARVRAEAATLVRNGTAAAEATRRAASRVFGSRPGAYGAGLQALIDEKGWEGAGDLARAYLEWGGYAYSAGGEGAAAHDLFETRLRQVDAVVQNQDNREHDLLDSSDYYQFEGGLAATVKHLSGAAPTVYHNDHARPETPRIRTLDEEVSRVVRARVVNPKWIAGCMRHGYKGAFEMAATVDYLFAFAATTDAVRDHHFDAVFDAYLRDDAVRAFLERANPHALREMSERLIEAQARHLWKPRTNSTRELLHACAHGRSPMDAGESR